MTHHSKPAVDKDDQDQDHFDRAALSERKAVTAPERGQILHAFF